MQISLTVILCLATGVVSWQALSNSELFSKLSLSPYRVKHNKEIYRLWSHTLVHADMGHLFFNLFALFRGVAGIQHLPHADYISQAVYHPGIG